MKRTYLLLIPAILILPLLYACKNSETAQTREQKIPVSIVHPKPVTSSFPIHVSGSLSSKTEMKLSFKTGGIIQFVNVDEGKWVKKDQLLAQLNTGEIKAQVNQARLGLEKSRRDMARVQELHADSVATLEQLQNSKTAMELAESQLNIAEFNLKFSSIHAPVNGKILKKLAEPNEMIAPGYPVFLFSSNESDWILRTNLVDIDVVRVKIKDAAEVNFDAFPGKVFKASISEIASSSDPYTGTYEVELRISRSDAGLVSGLIGSASILPSDVKDYLTLPVSAVHEANASEGIVYVAHGENYEKRLVKIMNISDSLIYLNGELSISDSIIYEGASYLIAGSKIQTID